MARPGRVTMGQVRGGAVGRGPRRRAPARAGRRPLLPGLGRHTLAVAATWAQLRGALTRGPGQPGQPLSRLPRRCWGASRPRGSRPCRGAVRPSVRPSVASCVSSPLFVGVASNGPMTWHRGRGPWRQHSRPWPPLHAATVPPHRGRVRGVAAARGPGPTLQPRVRVPPRSPGARVPPCGLRSGSHPAVRGLGPIPQPGCPGPTPQPGGPGPTLRARPSAPCAERGGRGPDRVRGGRRPGLRAPWAEGGSSLQPTCTISTLRRTLGGREAPSL